MITQIINFKSLAPIPKPLAAVSAGHPLEDIVEGGWPAVEAALLITPWVRVLPIHSRYLHSSQLFRFSNQNCSAPERGCEQVN